MPNWEKHAILCSFSRLIEGQTGAEEYLEIFLTLINILRKGTPLTFRAYIPEKLISVKTVSFHKKKKCEILYSFLTFANLNSKLQLK